MYLYKAIVFVVVFLNYALFLYMYLFKFISTQNKVCTVSCVIKYDIQLIDLKKSWYGMVSAGKKDE